jgi:hypothetical protein
LQTEQTNKFEQISKLEKIQSQKTNLKFKIDEISKKEKRNSGENIKEKEEI